MDLREALGAREAASLQKFSLYLPERDRNGAPVAEIEKWIEATLAIFGEINGGATRIPVAEGYWRPETGEPVREPTNLVYSYIRDADRFAANLDRLVRFIHSFGKHANQGEVMVEFSGEVPGRGFVERAYFIDEYPKAGERPF
ncbi:MAG TPA: hypothetical protein VGB59_00480 [Allosphingosinicella sp.]|jgi:hypothetical protein